MNALRLIGMLLLVAALAVSACGKKGDPIRPGEEPEHEDEEIFE